LLALDFDHNWNPPIKFSKNFAASNVMKVYIGVLKKGRQACIHGKVNSSVFTTFPCERAKSGT
jgi:hypothetical protein